MTPIAKAAARPIRFPEMLPHRWLRLGVYAAFWTVLGLLNAVSALIETLDDPGHQLWEPFVWEMSSLYTTGLLCPLVVQFVRRFPFSRRNWYWLIPVHGGAMILFSLAHTSGMVAIRKGVYALVGRSYQFADQDLWLELTYEFSKDVVLYWIIVLLALGFEYYNRYRGQQLEASSLEARLVQARLSNLEKQLNPHFLFNSLHMISSFVRRRPERAEQMIARLSDLLRLALDHSAGSEIRLRDELRALDLYLDLMNARFNDRVEVVRKIESDTLDVRVPVLILQPLVENAFRHGMAVRSEGGVIEISSRAENRLLHLAVRDNGPGMDESAPVQGLGLFTTGERLRLLYGDEHTLRVQNIEPGTKPPPFDGGGFEVRLTVPFRKNGREKAA